MKPLVSVPMVTYRHEAFVAEALESVAAQDHEHWEVVVGDDASPDGTIDVVRAFEARFPGKVRILPHETRVGPRQNFVRVLEACRGKYVAQLDGDDAFSWTGKLSSQVEFLERHTDHAMVFCASRKVWGDARDYDWFPPGRKPRYEMADLIDRCFSGSGAMMFRREHLDLPQWFHDAPVGDWPLHALNARHGSIGYIDRVGMMYRQHAAGRWAGLDDLRQLRVKIATREHIYRHIGFDGLAAPFERAMLLDRLREVELLHETGEADAARALLDASLASEAWSRHAEGRHRLRAARTLERIGDRPGARQMLARLLRSPEPDVPRFKAWRHWMSVSLRTLLRTSPGARSR